MKKKVLWVSEEGGVQLVRLYLSPEALQAYRDEPDGRLSREFCRMFRMSYDIFKMHVFDLAAEMWWKNWHEDAVDCFEKTYCRPLTQVDGSAI